LLRENRRARAYVIVGGLAHGASARLAIGHRSPPVGHVASVGAGCAHATIC
jgi:hypothetical protein